MLKKLLLALLLGSASAASAQINFRPGYVVMPAGDTLRGAINLRSEELNSWQAQLQLASGEVTKYTPADIKGYGLAGGQAWEAFRFMEEGQGEAVFFAERLLQGPASLYRGTRQGTEYHYLLTAAGGLQKLQNTRTLQQRNGMEVAVEGREYQRTLAAAFQECLQLQGAITKTPFKEKALLALLDSYNVTCAGAPARQQPAATNELVLQLEVLAGVQRGQVTLSGPVAYNGAAFQAITPTIGLGVSVSSLRTPKLALRLEGHYSREVYSGPHSTVASPNQEIKVSIDYLRVPLLLRYTLDYSGWKPLLEAGFLTNVAMRYADSWRRENRYGDYDDTPLLSAVNRRGLDIGFQVGVGATKLVGGAHPLSVLVRYNRSTGFISAVGLSADLSHWSATLAYSLSKVRPK